MDPLHIKAMPTLELTAICFRKSDIIEKFFQRGLIVMPVMLVLGIFLFASKISLRNDSIQAGDGTVDGLPQLSVPLQRKYAGFPKEVAQPGDSGNVDIWCYVRIDPTGE